MLQNFPTRMSVGHGHNTTIIAGELDSAPSSTYQVDFYSNDRCIETEVSGNRWIATTTVSTDPQGHANFDLTIPGSFNLITATATDDSNNTSEFSDCAAELERVPVLSDGFLFLLAISVIAVGYRVLARTS